MRQLGEQWIENGFDGKMHMYKAVEGPKIVNGLMEGNTCHGCCYVDKWDDDCLNPNQACPVGKGVIVKDLGPVNGDGLLPCPFCGEYPTIKEELDENDEIIYTVEHECSVLIEAGWYHDIQQAIEAWNRRAR